MIFKPSPSPHLGSIRLYLKLLCDLFAKLFCVFFPPLHGPQCHCLCNEGFVLHDGTVECGSHLAL